MDHECAYHKEKKNRIEQIGGPPVIEAFHFCLYLAPTHPNLDANAATIQNSFNLSFKPNECPVGRKISGDWRRCPFYKPR